MRRPIQAAKDADVLGRRWLLIDVDSIRPDADCSATNEEKEKAWGVIERAKAYLREQGWPEPVVADSGNGYHLLYRIDLPADDNGLVKRVLQRLSRFSTDDAEVDTQVSNASRLTKVYGTMARKGEHTRERPHRRSGVISMPERIEVVSVDLLQALAADAPRQPAASTVAPAAKQTTGDRAALLERAAKWLMSQEGAVSGERGHDHTFHVVCRLFENFSLTEDEAFPLVWEWSQQHCQPPWSESELRHKIRDAKQKMAERVAAIVSGEIDLDTLKEPNDPSRLARVFLAERCWHETGHTLRKWRAQWWRWSGSAYKCMTEDELAAEIWPVVETEFDKTYRQQLAQPKEGKKPRQVLKVTNSLVENVLGALAGMTTVGGDLEQPRWIDQETGGGSGELIAMKNGLLDLGALMSGLESQETGLSPHSPLWFSRVCLPYDFDPGAQCPKWMAFLEKNLEGDAERIALLQEWFGYCLTPDTSQQRFLVLEGEGCNGKSVACAVLTALLGEANVSHVALEGFGQRFTLTQTLGKLANIASEVGEIDKVAEGVLKSFTSGDRMMFDRKNIDPVEALPSARLVLATNNRPRFSDRSGGIWRRLLLMPFRVQIKQEERVYGMDKAGWWLQQGELPGVFNWAIEGLKRLRERGCFTEPKVCQEAVADYKTDCNPAREFLKELCKESKSGRALVETVYGDYQSWCKANGYQPMSNANFGKELARTYPSVTKERGTAKDDRRNVYVGLAHYPPHLGHAAHRVAQV
jgi:P4 family phage/plasmid primase-like protien